MTDPLKSLGLTSLAKVLPTLCEQARQSQLSYEAFFQRTLEAELEGRRERAQERRRRAAHLPTPKSLAAFDFSYQPMLSEPLVRELASLGFIQTATNILLLGPPGVGKTHLALALTDLALEAGYSARCVTLRQLAEDLDTVTWRQQLRRYIQPHVLVIDEMGYVRLSAAQSQQFFEVVTARYEKGPIILTSNRSFAEWGALLGDEVLATALLDRLLHHAEVLTINGRSYRMKDRLDPATAAEKKGGADHTAVGATLRST
jgi:DNA replication protein DnaC